MRSSIPGVPAGSSCSSRFGIERLPLYFLAPLVPFLLGGHGAVDDLRSEPRSARARSISPICSARRSARSAVTFLLQRFGGETALLLAAVAPLVAAACLSRRVAPVVGDCWASVLAVAALSPTSRRAASA